MMVKSVHRPQVAPVPSEELRICLLGGFQARIGQRTITESEWRLRKARSLVKLLALAPGHRLHREQVLDLLWPDLGPQPASNNLRKVLHAARHTLEPTSAPADSGRARYLHLDGESVALRSIGPLWIDVEAFEAAAATARREQNPQTYHAAIDLYAGDLLPDDLYEEWTARRRDELRGTFVDLLLRLARLHEARRDIEPAIEALKRVVSSDPLHEQTHRELMRLYALDGERQQALRQYRQLKETLSRELDVEPEEATTRLYEALITAPPAISAGTTEAQKHNLPAQLTSFIGRRKEMGEVKHLLASTRLLTLTGPGGCGKTRLAIETASTLVGRYPDGVWLVELAGLSDREFVAQALASALQVRERPGCSLTETLIGVLETKKSLLIFDNCEHLIETCAELAETLLRSCPHAQILATSREPLSIHGETAWTVPSLSLPEKGHLPSLEDLRECESTRLFVDRATPVLPGFSPAERDAPVIARICSQLDGIPLAIELAAARVKVLSLEQIAERLSDSFRWLAGGSRTAAPRHQTLSAAINWSYNLLSTKEQVLFRRLSVFAGGFTLQAVEAINSGQGIEQEEVLDILSRLVDKSLVQVPSERHEQGHSAEVRYRVLETLRQYGRERLEEHGEVGFTEQCHAAYFRALVQRAEPELRGPQQVAWLELLDRELDNLRAAHEWSRRHDAGIGLSIVGNLWLFWEIRGYHTEGRRWLAGLLPQAPARTVDRARALDCAAVLAMRQGEFADSEHLLTECLAIFEEIGDGQGAAGALERLGLLRYALGDFAESRKFLLRSVALFRSLGNIQGMGWALSDLGMVLRIEGDYETAAAVFEESLDYLREWGDRRGLAYILNNLGQLMRVEKNYERAQTLLEESLAVAREVGDKPFTSWALLCLGGVAQLQGRLELARSCFKEALRISGDVGYERHIAACVASLGVLAAQQGAYARCAHLIGAAITLHGGLRSSLDIDENEAWDEGLAAARDALGESGFAAAWAEGESTFLNASKAEGLALGSGRRAEALSLRRSAIDRIIEYAQGT